MTKKSKNVNDWYAKVLKIKEFQDLFEMNLCKYYVPKKFIIYYTLEDESYGIQFQRENNDEDLFEPIFFTIDPEEIKELN